MQFKDYYKTLGVPKTATQEEIRKAFRKLAREYHPDVAKDKKAAEAKFKDINEANEVLSDPDKRKRYDELGAGWDQPGRQGPPPGWEQAFGRGGGFDFGGSGAGGGGFSDFFEMFFGRRGAGGTGTRRAGFARRGEDAEFEMTVTLEDVLEGARKSFQVERGGRPETVTVRVPKGIRAGQRIRLAGQGNPGAGGGEAGDLYLRIRIAPHVDYRIEGDDLIRMVSIPVTTAVLGGEVKVTTPDGHLKLKVPAGTQPGQKFRVKGRGLPAEKGARGDFYAEVRVQIPTALTAEQRRLWEQIAAD